MVQVKIWNQRKKVFKSYCLPMLSLLCVEHMVPEALQKLPICFGFRAERQNANWLLPEAEEKRRATLWGGYISRIYPESTQELDQILGPFWFVYTTESSQDFKKVQTNQTGPRIWKTSWALSGLILVCLHFFSNPGDFLLCKQTRKGPEFDWVPGYFLGKFC